MLGFLRYAVTTVAGTVWRVAPKVLGVAPERRMREYWEAQVDAAASGVVTMDRGKYDEYGGVHMDTEYEWRMARGRMQVESEAEAVARLTGVRVEELKIVGGWITPLTFHPFVPPHPVITRFAPASHLDAATASVAYAMAKTSPHQDAPVAPVAQWQSNLAPAQANAFTSVPVVAPLAAGPGPYTMHAPGQSTFSTAFPSTFPTNGFATFPATAAVATAHPTVPSSAVNALAQQVPQATSTAPAAHTPFSFSFTPAVTSLPPQSTAPIVAPVPKVTSAPSTTFTFTSTLASAAPPAKPIVASTTTRQTFRFDSAEEMAMDGAAPSSSRPLALPTKAMPAPTPAPQKPVASTSAPRMSFRFDSAEEEAMNAYSESAAKPVAPTIQAAFAPASASTNGKANTGLGSGSTPFGSTAMLRDASLSSSVAETVLQTPPATPAVGFIADQSTGSPRPAKRGFEEEVRGGNTGYAGDDGQAARPFKKPFLGFSASSTTPSTSTTPAAAQQVTAPVSPSRLKRRLGENDEDAGANNANDQQARPAKRTYTGAVLTAPHVPGKPKAKRGREDSPSPSSSGSTSAPVATPAGPRTIKAMPSLDKGKGKAVATAESESAAEHKPKDKRKSKSKSSKKEKKEKKERKIRERATKPLPSTDTAPAPVEDEEEEEEEYREEGYGEEEYGEEEEEEEFVDDY
ncbi:hypothetical protein IAT38_004744 [Cryptococcus sp. DSM 104549]